MSRDLRKPTDAPTYTTPALFNELEDEFKEETRTKHIKYRRLSAGEGGAKTRVASSNPRSRDDNEPDRQAPAAGLFCVMMELPTKPFLLALASLDLRDLDSLARVSRRFRARMLATTTEPAWRDARLRLGITTDPVLYGVPSADFAMTAFSTDCTRCGKLTTEATDWWFLARLCGICSNAETMIAPTAYKDDRDEAAGGAADRTFFETLYFVDDGPILRTRDIEHQAEYLERLATDERRKRYLQYRHLTLEERDEFARSIHGDVARIASERLRRLWTAYTAYKDKQPAKVHDSMPPARDFVTLEPILSWWTSSPFEDAETGTLAGDVIDEVASEWIISIRQGLLLASLEQSVAEDMELSLDVAEWSSFTDDDLETVDFVACCDVSDCAGCSVVAPTPSGIPAVGTLAELLRHVDTDHTDLDSSILEPGRWVEAAPAFSAAVSPPFLAVKTDLATHVREWCTTNAQSDDAAQEEQARRMTIDDVERWWDSASNTRSGPVAVWSNAPVIKDEDVVRDVKSEGGTVAPQVTREVSVAHERIDEFSSWRHVLGSVQDRYNKWVNMFPEADEMPFPEPEMIFHSGPVATMDITVRA